MRYDEIKSLYPGIDFQLTKVADAIHVGIGDLMAYGIAEHWINREVAKEHRKAVEEKVMQFIHAVRAIQKEERRRRDRGGNLPGFFAGKEQVKTGSRAG